MINKKNKLLYLAIVILVLVLVFVIYINIIINLSKTRNEEVIAKFNELFPEKILEIADDIPDVFPKIEINGIDYIGVISIGKDKLLLPITNNCSKYLASISTNCNYSNESLIILGNNFKNSFWNFEAYDIGDKIDFTNTLGYTFQYRVEEIKRIESLSDLSEYRKDLIIVIKNYYDMEYVLLLCTVY